MVEYFMKLHSVVESTVNFHAWVDICEDVHIHDSLDAFSAFPFEPYMQKIQHCTASRNMTAEQVFRRTVERTARAFLQTRIHF